MTRQRKFALWAVSAIVVAIASFFVGSAFRPGENPHYVFDTSALAYEAPPAIAATSPGGFTGFGETAGDASRVVLSGRVVDQTETMMTLESSLGQRTSLTFGESPRVFRLESGDAALLKPGATVAVLLDDAGDTVESVLVLSQP